MLAQEKNQISAADAAGQGSCVAVETLGPD